MDFVVFSYDIVKDRRRARVQRALKAALVPVQKSVFEGPMKEGQPARTLEALRKLIDPRRDSVRLYHLCPQCRRRVALAGVAAAVPLVPEDVVVQ